MIVVLLNSYLALLALFVWLHFIPFNIFWKLSPVLMALVLLVGLLIPAGWGAPSRQVVTRPEQEAPSRRATIADLDRSPQLTARLASE